VGHRPRRLAYCQVDKPSGGRTHLSRTAMSLVGGYPGVPMFHRPLSDV
jgi:hypothetical protein